MFWALQGVHGVCGVDLNHAMCRPTPLRPRGESSRGRYPKDTVEFALDYKSLVYAIRPGIVIPEKEQKETPAKSPRGMRTC